MEHVERALRDSPAVEIIRLDILMQYYAGLGSGTAALRWTDPLGGGLTIQPHLVALLYGRILRVLPVTRAELFARVGKLAMQNVLSKGASGFEFAPWSRHAGLGKAEMTLWPWLIVPAEQISTPKIYTAILKLAEPTATAPTGRWLHLEMAAGLEEILAPSAVLIAIAGLSMSCDRETRYLLARLLWQMNLFWGSPNTVPLYSEAVAYAAAEAAIRTKPFGVS